jgi:multiple sugar transport system permease protein
MTVVTAAPPARAGMMRRLDVAGAAISLLTLAIALLWAFPLYWAAFATVVPGQGGSLFGFVQNYAYRLFQTNLGRFYINSLVTSGGITIAVLAISSACGYALSQIAFTGRKVLWIVILASFMIPVQALIVNHFFLIHQWGLFNTWLGVIMPQLIAPVAVIVYKQFFDGVPKEFREAAQIDGARHWEIFLRIYLPMNWGVTTALGIIVFIGAWNAFLWPFLVTNKPEVMTVTAGVTQFREGGVNELTVALLSGLPVAVLYLLFQRRVSEGISFAAGIKA